MPKPPSKPAKPPAAPKKPATKTAAAPAAPPPIGKLGAKALAALADKLAKLGAEYKIQQALAAAAKGVTPGALLWHLVKHGLVRGERGSILNMLSDEREAGDADTIVEILRRLPGDEPAALGGITVATLVLVADAYAADPAPFRDAAASLPEPGARALAYVQRAAGETIAPAHAAALLDGLAVLQSTTGGLAGQRLPWIEAGRAVERDLPRPEDVRELALRFGTRADWDRALLRGAMRGAWRSDGVNDSIAAVRDALAIATPAELVQLLSRRTPLTLDERTGMLTRLDERADTPGALVAAARSVDARPAFARIDSEEESTGPSDPSSTRDLLLIAAARRCAALGAEVPAGLERMLEFTFASPREAVVAALRTVPRDRLLAAVRAHRDDDHFPQMAVALAGHFDPELFASLIPTLEGRGLRAAEDVEAIGAPAVEPLIRSGWIDAGTDDKRTWRRTVLLRAIAGAADDGAAFDPAWLRYVDFDDRPYWDPSDGTVRARIVAALPTTRRRSIVLDAMRDAPRPDRAFAIVPALADQIDIDAALGILVERRADIGDPVLDALRTPLHALGDRALRAFDAQLAAIATDRGFAVSLLDQMSYAGLDVAAARAALARQ